MVFLCFGPKPILIKGGKPLDFFHANILGPKSHVSLATLVALLLAMTMEIWDHLCGPFRRIFAVFAILGQVGNAISPWGKGSSQKPVTAVVAYDQGSILLEVCICFSGLAGVMLLRVPATLPTFAFLTVFCPDA